MYTKQLEHILQFLHVSDNFMDTVGGHGAGRSRCWSNISRMKGHEVIKGATVLKQHHENTHQVTAALSLCHSSLQTGDELHQN